MAISIVQNIASSAVTAASVAATLSSNVKAGDTLLMAIELRSNASVSSVTDNLSNRWIQVAYAYDSGTNGVELWMARGATAGSTTVTVDMTTSNACGMNVSEWSGIATAYPIDQWSQTNGTSASVSPTAVTPRANGDMFFAVAEGNTTLTHTSDSYTTLSVGGRTDDGAAYFVSSGSVASTTHWTQTSSDPYAAVAVCFQAGSQYVNPKLQFPEVLVQMCTLPDYQAPLLGQGVWTDVSNYCQKMSLGPIGRQHELDRVQAATASFTFDNRFGYFNPWNTQSFLYNDGAGLLPMNPVKVTAAWNGVTYPRYYGYFQQIANSISDVLDVDATLQCVDIFQLLSLKYLTSNNYAQLVESDGGANLKAFYRLGDAVNSFGTKDSSGNSQTGSLIAGLGGPPAYGAAGVYLYDSSTALDLTNGTNVANGGFQTVDNTTSPPTAHNPLSGASVWTVEMWFQWNSQSTTVPGATTTFTASGTSGGNTLTSYSNQSGGNSLPNIAVGSLIVGPDVVSGTVATAVTTTAGKTVITLSNNISGGSPSNQVYTATQGGAPSVLAYLNAGGGGHPIAFGVGQTTTASVTTYNGVVIGNYSGVLAPVLSSTDVTAEDGEWHHLAVTYQASVASIYVNGAFSGSVNPVFNWVFPYDITIGCAPGGAWSVPASIQDVALYSEVLTATQIENHYTTGMWLQSAELGAAATGGTSTNRLAKLLSIIGLPTSMLNVPYPFRTYLYAETDVVTTTSGLNYLQTMTETEPGLVYQAPNGAINAYSRQYQYLNATSTTSQGTFGDSTSAAYHYEGPSFVLAQDDLDIFNDIQVQSGNTSSGGSITEVGQLQEWGPDQSTSMATSASIYGARTLQGLTSLQFENDSDVLAVAQNYAQWYGYPIIRVQAITCNSFANGGANLPQMLARNLYDCITVQYEGQVVGPQFSQEALIESVTDDVNLANPSWQTTWALSPYELLMEPMCLGEWTFGGNDGVLTL